MSRTRESARLPRLEALEGRALLTTNGQIVQALSQSAEYLQGIVVADYQKFLGRAPAKDEINYYVGQMQVGRSDESVLAGFAGSPEYYKTTGGTDPAWVTAMYGAILGRKPTADEVSSYVASLAGGNSRYNISLGFARSPEHEGQVVTADYLTDLKRTPSSAEASSWVAVFEAGQSNESLVASFVGSNEFTLLHDQADANLVNADYLAILGRSPQANELSYDIGLLEGTGPTNLPQSAVYNIVVMGSVNSTIAYASNGLLGISPTIPTPNAPKPINPRDVGLDLNPIAAGTNGTLDFTSNRALFQAITSAGDLSPLVLGSVSGDANAGTLKVSAILGVVNKSINKNLFDFAVTGGGTVQTYLISQGTVSLQVIQGGALVTGTINLSGIPSTGGKLVSIVLTIQGSLA